MRPKFLRHPQALASCSLARCSALIVLPELEREVDEAVGLEHRGDVEAILQRVRFDERRSHRRLIAHFEIRIAVRL